MAGLDISAQQSCRLQEDWPELLDSSHLQEDRLLRLSLPPDQGGAQQAVHLPRGEGAGPGWKIRPVYQRAEVWQRLRVSPLRQQGEGRPEDLPPGQRLHLRRLRQSHQPRRGEDGGEEGSVAHTAQQPQDCQSGANPPDR